MMCLKLRIYWHSKRRRSRRMMYLSNCCRSIVGGCKMFPRRRLLTYLVLLVTGILTLLIVRAINERFARENILEKNLTNLHAHLQFLQFMYLNRQEDIINLQRKISRKYDHTPLTDPQENMPSTVVSLLNNMTGLKAATGFTDIRSLRMPFVYQLLPHMIQDANSMKPAYHMRSRRQFSDVVLGIPTVKRDKQSYLMTTLTHLVNGMTEEDQKSCIIVVMVGDTDLEFVLRTAQDIELKFPQAVASGLIEVISPSKGYYPDMNTIPLTLGDSKKRVMWRTKQNLDAIFLMAYAQIKGVYYLMLEDDIIAKKNYVQEIKDFAAATTISTPDWFFLEFCHVGGIGKLFRSSRLIHFITYLQLFYYNMPIDWLLESYLADLVCSMDRATESCAKNKLTVRPKYKHSLFQHIGLYSSLKGKIQKVKDRSFGPVPTFFPHSNPPLLLLRTDIEANNAHTLQSAYEGKAFFWGETPKKGNVVEFWFKKPMVFERFMFRSGNARYPHDKFYETLVEVKGPIGNFTTVGHFDEFGLADGHIRKDFGPISVFRLRVLVDSTYWVILSEIDLRPANAGR